MEDGLVDVTILRDGDIVHYLDREGKSVILLEGKVEGDKNPYTNGVMLHGDTWRQYVTRWDIVGVERNGQFIFNKMEGLA